MDRADLDAEAREQAAELLVKLYPCYIEGDCDLAEINPLILTPEGRVHALDAKVTLDDNAAYRHPEWEEFAGTTSEDDPRETLAKEQGLNYIGLSGTVGIIANGAGLAMSTLDVVNQAGGRRPTSSTSAAARTPTSWPPPSRSSTPTRPCKSIFVNIFGGITRVDEVAKGILEALGRVDIELAHRHAPRRHQRRRGPGAPGRPPVRPPGRRADHARCRPPGRRCWQPRTRRQDHVSIFVDETTKVVVQGISPTSQGLYHGLRNKAYGTKVVARHQPEAGR